MKIDAYVEGGIPRELDAESVDKEAVDELVQDIEGEEAALAHDGLTQVVYQEAGQDIDIREVERIERQAAAYRRRQARLHAAQAQQAHKKVAGSYMKEVGDVPLLTQQQEIELAKTIEAGQLATERVRQGQQSRDLTEAIQNAKDAKDLFIRANLRLVVSVAKKYPIPPNLELMDLVQEGNLGLEHAVDKFEWRKGFRFSTYATFWIRQAIGRALDRKSNLIRLPGDLPTQLRHAMAAQSQEQDDSVGDQLKGEVGKAYRAATPIPLNKELGEGGGELGDMLPSEEASPEEALVDLYETMRLYDRITDIASSEMEPRHWNAVRLRYFGEPDGTLMSYKEIGERCGVTAEAARRWVVHGLDRLRIDFGTPTDNERRRNRRRRKAN